MDTPNSSTPRSGKTFIAPPRTTTRRTMGKWSIPELKAAHWPNKKNRIHRKLDSRQQFRRGCLPNRCPHQQPLASILQMENFHRSSLGVNDPILFDAVLLVEVALLNPIAVAVAERHHFDYQVRRTSNCPLDDAQPVARNEYRVGLHDEVRRQDHVYRTMNNRSGVMGACPLIKLPRNAHDNLLMIERR